uniref:Uncharacterized protein n=1 Tax=viral metagenome TaxID=1070528 RepID=A0A6C0E0Q3_9ZZZZ
MTLSLKSKLKKNISVQKNIISKTIFVLCV